IALPLRRIPYPEAMLRYGSDKPDLRYGLEIVDATELFGGPEYLFSHFREVIEAGGKVRGINAKGAAEQFSRKAVDGLKDLVKASGGKDLAPSKFTAEKVISPFWSV